MKTMHLLKVIAIVAIIDFIFFLTHKRVVLKTKTSETLLHIDIEAGMNDDVIK